MIGLAILAANFQRIKIISIVSILTVILFTCYLISYNNDYHKDFMEYKKTLSSVVATVTDVHTHTAHDSEGDPYTEYLPTYKYTIQGQTYEHYDQLGQRRSVDIGDKVRLYYENNDPSTVKTKEQVEAPESVLHGFNIGFGFFAFVSLLLSVSALFGRVQKINRRTEFRVNGRRLF